MTQLQRTLGPLLIWGLGVGYVISGAYFGWNLGLPEGGPYGMLLATGVVTVLYVTFVLGYAELSCALPRAGGAFVYTSRAFGPHVGFLGGAAQLVEYVLAPPAIAFAIGAYVHQTMPALPIPVVAVGAYLLFTAINIWGVKLSVGFELRADDYRGRRAVRVRHRRSVARIGIDHRVPTGWSASSRSRPARPVTSF